MARMIAEFTRMVRGRSGLTSDGAQQRRSRVGDRATPLRLASLCAVIVLVAFAVLLPAGVVFPLKTMLRVPVGGWFTLAAADCTPAFPHVLVFTRVPKTGSETMWAILRDLAVPEGNNFSISAAHGGSVEELRAAIGVALSLPGRSVILWHTPFAGDAPALRNGRVAYFSMVREPSARCVSNYYYSRWLFSKMRAEGKLLHPSERETVLVETRNLTLDACLASLQRNSVAPTLPPCFTCHPTAQAAYFYEATGEVRAAASAEILHVATRTASAHYRVVGVTEAFVDTVDVLERVFPEFFSGSGALYRSYNSEYSHTNSHELPGRLWTPPSPDTLAALALLVSPDAAFYALMHARFLAQVAACAIPPRPSPSSRPRARMSCERGDVLHNWDVPGASSELRGLRESSPEACCRACVADAACAAWVWRGGDCWLKADARTLRPQVVGKLVAGFIRDAALETP